MLRVIYSQVRLTSVPTIGLHSDVKKTIFNNTCGIYRGEASKNPVLLVWVMKNSLESHRGKHTHRTTYFAPHTLFQTVCELVLKYDCGV